jgi:hypothetical protein
MSFQSIYPLLTIVGTGIVLCGNLTVAQPYNSGDNTTVAPRVASTTEATPMNEPYPTYSTASPTPTQAP